MIEFFNPPVPCLHEIWGSKFQQVPEISSRRSWSSSPLHLLEQLISASRVPCHGSKMLSSLHFRLSRRHELSISGLKGENARDAGEIGRVVQFSQLIAAKLYARLGDRAGFELVRFDKSCRSVCNLFLRENTTADWLSTQTLSLNPRSLSPVVFIDTTICVCCGRAKERTGQILHGHGRQEVPRLCERHGELRRRLS